MLDGKPDVAIHGVGSTSVIGILSVSNSVSVVPSDTVSWISRVAGPALKPSDPVWPTALTVDSVVHVPLGNTPEAPPHSTVSLSDMTRTNGGWTIHPVTRTVD